MMELYIGTSGWDYEHWRGIFYPENLRRRDWFHYYMGYFNSVEINYTFYHFPKEETIAKWKEDVPDNFKFAFKASRLITHSDNLKSAGYLLWLFMKRIKVLGRNLGPLLLQFPPEVDSLEHVTFFLEKVKNSEVAIEFRNRNLHTREETFSLLEEYRVAYCIVNSPSLPTIYRATSPLVYMRFHGSTEWYSSKYSEDELKEFKDHILKFLEEGRRVFVYFNNDVGGYAPQNAIELKKLIMEEINSS